eukprot:UN29174
MSPYVKRLFLVSKLWHNAWRKGEPLPPEQNQILLEPKNGFNHLRKDLEYDYDYVFMDILGWEQVKEICQPKIERKIITKGLQRRVYLETFPCCLIIYFCADDGSVDDNSEMKVTWSKVKPLSELLDEFEATELMLNNQKPAKRIWRQEDTITYINKGWYLLEQDSVRQNTGSFLTSPTQPIKLLIESQTRSCKWCRNYRNKSFNYNSLTINELVDAKDVQNKWYKAMIRKHNKSKGTMVHFCGWSAKYDEWISLTDAKDRIAPYGVYTKHLKNNNCDSSVIDLNSPVNNQTTMGGNKKRSCATYLLKDSQKNVKKKPVERGVVGFV